MMLSKGDQTTVDKNVDRKNLFCDNILKITILLKKFDFQNITIGKIFFLSKFLSTVVRSPLDNIMKDKCRDLQWLYRPGILLMHFLNQSEAL